MYFLTRRPLSRQGRPTGILNNQLGIFRAKVFILDLLCIGYMLFGFILLFCISTVLHNQIIELKLKTSCGFKLFSKEVYPQLEMGFSGREYWDFPYLWGIVGSTPRRRYCERAWNGLGYSA